MAAGDELLADPYAASSAAAAKGLPSGAPSLPPGSGWAATEQLQREQRFSNPAPIQCNP